ncbi:MAG: hypothetical protein MZW92_68660 [Comamonadaceae bacterium]|nr:hypothetical protein [Comamonadaceae bacterium]
MLFGALAALALEPPTKEQIARYRAEGTLAARAAQARSYGNHKIPERIQDRIEYKLSRLALDRGEIGVAQAARLLAPPRAWEGMPTSGNVRILALLISFSDYPGTTTPESFANRLFGDGVGNPPFDSLRDFYTALVLQPADDHRRRPRLVPGALRPEHRRRDGRWPRRT